MQLITGPILGQLSNGKLRILLEFDQEISLQICYFDIKTPEKILTKTCDKNKAYRPFIVTIDSLFTGSYCYIIKRGEHEFWKGYFRVSLPNEDLKIIVVSCNALHMLKEEDLDLWDNINKKYGGTNEEPSKIDLLLHIGDQIYEYGRDVWKRCYNYMLLLQEGEGKTHGKNLYNVDKNLGYQNEWEPLNQFYDLNDLRDVMTELFRSLYRQQWSHKPTREIMSKVSNQMILDDHDIRNGWGIQEEDRQPDTIEYIIGECAHAAYEEYQVQLWRDIDNNYHIDHRFLIKNKTAIFLMDVRNPRTFCYNSKSPYVGDEQMVSISELLKKDDIKNLLLVCSIPIILSNEYITGLASKVDITCDTRDQWCVGTNKPEHSKLLSMISDWKKKDPSRNALLVGGDIHMGMKSIIKENNEIICEQIVTSPITNEPTTGLIGWLQNTFILGKFSLYGRYDIEHYCKIHQRNYALIENTNDKWIHKLCTE